MIKRLARKEMREEILALITKRANALISTANTVNPSLDDEERKLLRERAWELEMVLQDIERNLRS